MDDFFVVYPETSRAALELEMGVTDARCVTLALEEMFIELAGGRS
jgi:hypothetical protein